MCDVENLLVLQDENGEETEFEFLDLVELDGEEYVVILPVEDVDPHEVVILKVGEIDEDGLEMYSSVDDDDELMRIFAVFKKRCKDDFNWAD